jgi:hypothetical protein
MKMAELGSKEALAQLSHEMNEISQRLSLLKYEQPIEHGDEQPQVMSQAPMDGGMPAAPEQDYQDPTGGVPPGLPMEGV